MLTVKEVKNFKSEEECIEYLEAKRWNGKPVCPNCKSENTNKLVKEKRHHCNGCRKSFSVTVGTLMHHTHLPLKTWLMAIALILEAKKGISSRQLARHLDLPVKTAWSLGFRIRKAFKQGDKEAVAGIFEMDETYIKSKKKDEDDFDDWDGTKRRETHTSVVGIKEKGGNINAFAVHNTTFVTLVNVALGIAKRGSEIHTDEFKAYNKFSQYFKHKTVNHSKEYVTADKIHCNSVEGFWSLLKRGIKGNYHWLSKKHLQSYINEFVFKYNNAKEDKNFVFDGVINRVLKI